MNCSRRLATARSGAGTGWIWSATATPRGLSRIPICCMRGAIATTSSSPSIRTSRTIASLRSRSPETNCIPTIPSRRRGTGYYTVGPNRDMLYKVEDINRVETLTDYVDTTGSVFLGLDCRHARVATTTSSIRSRSVTTIACRRSSCRPKRRESSSSTIRRAATILADNLRQAKLREIGDQLEGILKPYQKKLSDEKLAKLPADVRDAFATEEGKRTPAQRAIVEENRKKICCRRRGSPGDPDRRITRPRFTRSKGSWSACSPATRPVRLLRECTISAVRLPRRSCQPRPADRPEEVECRDCCRRSAAAISRSLRSMRSLPIAGRRSRSGSPARRIR